MIIVNHLNPLQLQSLYFAAQDARVADYCAENIFFDIMSLFCRKSTISLLVWNNILPRRNFNKKPKTFSRAFCGVRKFNTDAVHFKLGLQAFPDCSGSLFSKPQVDLHPIWQHTADLHPDLNALLEHEKC